MLLTRCLCKKSVLHVYGLLFCAPVLSFVSLWVLAGLHRSTGRFYRYVPMVNSSSRFTFGGKRSKRGPTCKCGPKALEGLWKPSSKGRKSIWCKTLPTWYFTQIHINPFTALCMCTTRHKMTKSNVIPAVKGLNNTNWR